MTIFVYRDRAERYFISRVGTEEITNFYFINMSVIKFPLRKKNRYNESF